MQYSSTNDFVIRQQHLREVHPIAVPPAVLWYYLANSLAAD